MNQPDINARLRYDEIVNDTPTTVIIPKTKKKVKLTGVKPYTLERLTKIWLDRDAAIANSGSDVLKDMCKEPYFAIKEACLFVLNDFWKIQFVYPIMWRIWAYLRGYTEAQMTPIIVEGKKKLLLMAHWTNMAFSVDMRMDWMKMTKKEAEQYRAELLSVAKQPSLRSSLNSEGLEDSSESQSAIGVTDAN